MFYGSASDLPVGLGIMSDVRWWEGSWRVVMESDFMHSLSMVDWSECFVSSLSPQWMGNVHLGCIILLKWRNGNGRSYEFGL